MRHKRTALMQWLFVAWIVVVYGFHYLTYYGPRVVRFLQHLAER